MSKSKQVERKVTFTSLDIDYCVSLIESVMDSENFTGWPFGNK